MILKVIHADTTGGLPPVIETHYFDNVVHFSTRPVTMLTTDELPESFLGLYHENDDKGFALLSMYGDGEPKHAVYVPGWAYAMDDRGRTIERL